MAVRADDGQSRSYLVSNILGVSPTQVSFSPRYPIELTPSGPQSISDNGALRGDPRASGRPLVERQDFWATRSGPTYVYRCTVCRKLFERKTQDLSLRPHKNPAGWACYGTSGSYVRTKY